MPLGDHIFAEIAREAFHCEPFVVGFKSFKIFKRRDPMNRLHFRQWLCQRVRPRPSNTPEQHVRAASELIGVNELAIVFSRQESML